MNRVFLLSVLVAGIILQPQACVAQQKGPAQTVDDQINAALPKLWQQFNEQYMGGKITEAAGTIGQIVQLERGRKTPQPATLANALDSLALAKAHSGDQAAARSAAAECVSQYERAFRAEAWQTIYARSRQKLVDALLKLNAEQRKEIRNTNQPLVAAMQAAQAGKYPEALSLAAPMVQKRIQLLGKEHGIVAAAIRDLGHYTVGVGNAAEGEKLLREGVELLERTLGPENPETLGGRSQLAVTLQALKRYDEAEGLLLDVMKTQSRLWGAESEPVALSTQALALLFQNKKDFTKAEEHYQKALAIRRKVHGEQHLLTAFSCDFLGKFYAYQWDGHEAQALPLFLQCLEIRQKQLGEEHRLTIDTLDDLAFAHSELNQFEKAEPLYLKLLSIRRKVLGPAHEVTLETLDDLATEYSERGQFSKALPLRIEILEANRQAHGEEHLSTAASLHELGDLENNLGRFPQALGYVTKAVEVRKKLAGPEDHATLASQRLLAAIYGNLAQNSTQERLLAGCLAGFQKLYGEGHLATAATMRDLGSLYVSTREFAKAEGMFTQSLAIARRLEEEPGADTVLSLWMLGAAQLAQGKYGMAEQSINDAVESCRRWRGKDSFLVGMLESFLGLTYQCQGKLDQAEQIHRRTVAGSSQLLGAEHPLVSRFRFLLCTLLHQKGKHGEAMAELRIVLDQCRSQLEECLAVADESASLEMADSFRMYIDSAIALALQNETYAAEVYEHVLRFKGQLLARQRFLRAVADVPAARKTWSDLQQASADLAAHSRVQPEADALGQWQSRLDDLSSKVSDLSKQLTKSSAALRGAIQDVTSQQILNTLPPDGVLVDVVQYNFAEFPKPNEKLPTPETRLAVFIARPGKPIQLVELGADQPLKEAIEAWRSDFGGKLPSSQKAGALLREKFWLPIEKHLAGARLILVSPDGDLARLPVAALPGKTPGSYLLEEYTISLIPSAQAIPELLKDDQAGLRPEGNLLLVGGVDYEARPGANKAEQPRAFKDFQSFAARGGAQLVFPPLAGARDEVLVIEREYADLIDRQRRGMTLLEGADASEEAFRRLAPRYSYLHVATHGFFAPPEIKSALDRPASAQVALLGDFVTKQSIAGFHPGLLSGIALAGASNPGDEGDDGILTAQEVSTLDLRAVKLVVLSACETGLGEVAGGEGLLGLQRSFQAAGARSVIASLWKVDDLVTRDLMKRFYDNLWNKGLSKSEALREAQLWLLRERGPRGLIPVESAAPSTNRLPPFYWAAFTLSGDWR